MKILVISNLFPPTFLGGYELGCAQVVGRLREAGHTVTVVTSSGAESAAEETDVHRVLHLPPIYNSDRMGLMLPQVQEHFQVSARTVNAANAQALAAVADELKPDVVYLWNLLGIGGLGILGVLRYMGIPWVWHIMDMIPRQLCAIRDDALPALASRFSRFFPGRYISCSTRAAEEIRDGGVDIGRDVRLIPNWVEERPKLSREFFGGGHLRAVCAVGTLSESKGTDILIEAAARLQSLGFANFSIDLFGREVDGRYRAMVHRYRLDGAISFRGILPQKALVEQYVNHDLFIFPTWEREPMGFAPLEAAAAGCPPLITADCGYSEWFVDHVHCLKAQRSASAFASRLSEILRGDVDLGAVARRAQHAVTSDFGLGHLLPQIEQELAFASSERRSPLGEIRDLTRLSRYAEALSHVLVDEAV